MTEQNTSSEPVTLPAWHQLAKVRAADPLNPDTAPLTRAQHVMADRLYGLQQLAGVGVAGALHEAWDEFVAQVDRVVGSQREALAAAQQTTSSIDAAQRLVFAMHHAATGIPADEAPDQGFVEDVAAVRAALDSERAGRATAQERLEQAPPRPEFEAVKAERDALRATITEWARKGILRQSTASSALGRASRLGDQEWAATDVAWRREGEPTS